MVTGMMDKKKSLIMNIGEIKQNNTMIESTVPINDTSKTAAIILSVGLLVHNIFEGMSIGLSKTKADLIIIMIAVCSHKMITAFSLGLAF